MPPHYRTTKGGNVQRMAQAEAKEGPQLRSASASQAAVAAAFSSARHGPAERLAEPASARLIPRASGGRRPAAALAASCFSTITSHSMPCERSASSTTTRNSLPSLRVGANMRVANLRGIDDAADDQRGACAVSRLARAAGVLDQRVHRLLRATLHDLHAARNLRASLSSCEEAVVVRLTRLGHVGIAQLDDSARDDGRRRGWSGQHDRDGDSRT